MERRVGDVTALAADWLEAAITEVVAARGRCAIALSGGRTPWGALRALADRAVPWDRVDVLQVDEREAPAGHPDRNLTGLRAALPAAARVHPMPVEHADADVRYARTLAELCPAGIDVVHLGLGDDGHTASLVPGDPALEATSPVAWTGVYQGRRRLTLTFPTLDATQRVLWLVSGASKAAMVARLEAGDPTIPAGRVRAARPVLVCDAAAATPPGTAPAAPG